MEWICYFCTRLFPVLISISGWIKLYGFVGGPGKDSKNWRMPNISGDPNYGTLEFRGPFLPKILFCQHQLSRISNSNVQKFPGENCDRCTAIFRSWCSVTHQNEEYWWVSQTNFNNPRGWWLTFCPHIGALWRKFISSFLEWDCMKSW